MLRPSSVALLALLVHGCGTAAQEQVLRRASFELRCPEEQLQVIELDERTQGVRGCGVQVQYVEICDGPRDSVDTVCRWVLSAPPPPPAAAPPVWTQPVMPPVQPSVRPPIQTAPPPRRPPR